MNEHEVDKHINEIIKNFRWDRVCNCMRVLNWKWHDRGIPTKDELINTARRLLQSSWEIRGKIISGGFVAEYHNNSFSLLFCVDEWDSDVLNCGLKSKPHGRILEIDNG